MNSLEASELPTANHALGVSVLLTQQEYRNLDLDLLSLRIVEEETHLTALHYQQSHLKTGYELLKLQALQNKINAATHETLPPSHPATARQTKINAPIMPDPTQSASLKPELTDARIRLALYALDSALKPSGVFLEIDISDLAPDLNYIQSLSPTARYQFALNLLQQQAV
jgi:hypothetical protein